ncbi:MAG: Holliday junction resolvase RuvX [Chloroflexi bacterium]|jgi:putative Holliday junction resolvase|nr:Holliday junction resolvase RuvX [Chloroflexota bacterium]
MRHLALDVGDERIGVAISDPDGVLARPLEVIPRRAGPSSFLRLADIIAENHVEVIVVGLPLREDGTEGKQVESTRAYVRGLVKYVDIPIVYWDERYSTNRATEIMIESGRKRQRRKEMVDAVAAAVILQEYLDNKAGGPQL